MSERYNFTYVIKQNYKAVIEEHITTPFENDIECARCNLMKYLKTKYPDSDEIILSGGISERVSNERLKESISLFQQMKK